MIAERSEREKRSFHVSADRLRKLAAFCRGLAVGVLLGFSAERSVTSVHAQQSADPLAPVASGMTGEGGADGATMFLPWPEEGVPGEEGQDREADDEEPGRQTRTFDPERLALWPVLRIGMVLDPAKGEFSGVEPFRANLEARLGIPAVVVAFSSLSRLQEGLLRGEVDYAPLSTTAFVDGQARCSCLDPLAVPLGAGGVGGWSLLVIVPRDGRFKGLKTLGSARVALAPEGSTAGRRLPLALLDEAGVSLDGEQLVETGGPLEAVEAVIAGRADVAFGWAPTMPDGTLVEGGTLAAFLARHGARPAIEVVPVLGPIPAAPHVVRTDLPESLREELRSLLGAVSVSEEGFSGGGAGFQPVSQQDFELLAPLTAGTGGDGVVRGRLRQLVPR